VFSGGDGILYAVQDNGDLLWYRHDGWRDGSFTWAAGSGKRVGTRWSSQQVFAG
jgi:Tachylectin